MKIIDTTIVLALLAAAPFGAPLAADDGLDHPADWPQYRGPSRDGVATPAAMLERWDAAPPAQRWRRSIGSGFSGIAVAEGGLFTMEADGERELVIRLDPATGETVWRTPIGTTYRDQFGDGPRATPAVADGVVYAASGDAQLAALDAADGRVLWRHDLPATFGVEVPRFGYSPSPLVDGAQVLIEVGEGERSGGALIAFDRKTGAVRWRALGGPAGHSSPIVATIGGVRQYVYSRRVGPEVIGLSTNGAVLWRHEGTRIALPMPVFVPPDRIFVASSDDAYGGVMLRVAFDGGEARVEQLWHNRRMRNHFNDSVVVGDHLYGFDNATFKCLATADGEQAWATRGFGKGSIVVSGDRLIVLGDDGTLALVEATPEAYREHGRFQAMEGRSWTSPTLAGHDLYLRDHDEVVAYDLATPASRTEDGP